MVVGHVLKPPRLLTCFFQRVVDRVLVGALVDACQEPYQQLRVPKYSHRQAQVTAPDLQAPQARDRFAQGIGLGLVVGEALTKILARANDLNAIRVQNDEATRPLPLLAAPIELHMH